MPSKILIILILFLAIPLFSQSDLRVLLSDNNSIIIEYTPIFTDSSEIRINNQKYLRLALLAGDSQQPDQWGMPAVQERIISLGVPSEFGNTIQILNSSYKEFSGQLSPLATPEKSEEGITYKYELSDDYMNYSPLEDPVVFGNFGVARGLPIQTLRILPIQFDPSKNSIKIYDKIVFQVTFSKSQEITFESNDDHLIKGAVINFESARKWIKPASQRLNKVVENSVLNSGKWVRFEAPEEGFYKIPQSMLASLGIDANTVDPRTIKIYNNGGKEIPEGIHSPRPQDLVENAILVAGQDDGKFDEGDYILFYGRGNNFWDFDTTSGTVKRFFNKYSGQNYFWITSGGAPGKRITEKPGLSSPDPIIQTTTKGYAEWEEDKINIGKSGRVYLGDEFTSSVSSRTYTTKLDGRLEGMPINYRFNFINASAISFSLQVFENNNQIFNQNLIGYGSGSSVYRYGVEHPKTISYSGNLPENRSVLKFQITPSTSSSVGYIDFVEFTYDRDMQAYGDYIRFFSNEFTGLTEYRLSGFSNSNIRVFDITDHADVKMITSPIMHSGSEFRFIINEEDPLVLSKYIGIGNDNFKAPVNQVEIGNQNIRGISSGAEYVIITHKNFRPEADRLKNYRETESIVTYSSIVIDVEEIFNEFSGGNMDPSAIRDFVKHAYDNWLVRPRFVLLFGDGTYDIKNLENMNNNFIPTYQTAVYLDEILAYPMDDYFARVEGQNFDQQIDLAIGRLTIQSLNEARIAVDKIISYEQDQPNGTWRNLITLVADDGLTSNNNEGSLHTGQSEDLARLKIPKSFDLNKLYLADYPTVITGIGRTKPGVFNDIVSSINQGTVIINFIGHGSPDLWTHERVFDKNITIPQLVNDKYFFLTAATCDFAFFDLPGIQSGAEVLVMKEGSGAIGVFSASRPVYSDRNFNLLIEFYQRLFGSARDTMNLPITIGEAYFKTKSARIDPNDNKYFLLGDPALRLALPQYSATIDSINGQGLTENIQIKALSNIVLQGQVRRPDNTPWDDFFGEGILTVFDSERRVSLPQINNYQMDVQGGVIFKGRVSINNGKFSTDFVVPKDISYENRNGKIVIYFFNDQNDGIGFTNNVIVGGTDSSVANDGKGPEIEIYFDNETASFASLANPNSELIIKLYDETGLNTTGTGIGHKLEGILNDRDNDPIDFSNYFTGDLNAGGKSGKINYRFNNLEPGEYKLLVKAWDVFNNYSEETSYFSVVSGNELVIRDVVNYPNPFVSSTTFTFQQNLNRILDVKIKIYTIAGRLIKEIEQNGISDKFVMVDWDGRDQDGSIIANGTYFYKLIIKTIDGEYTESVLGKLAVIR
jgi:hypothetical protein